MNKNNNAVVIWKNGEQKYFNFQIPYAHKRPANKNSHNKGASLYAFLFKVQGSNNDFYQNNRLPWIPFTGKDRVKGPMSIIIHILLRGLHAVGSRLQLFQ